MRLAKNRECASPSGNAAIVAANSEQASAFTARREHLLDDALKDSFPASDPHSIAERLSRASSCLSAAVVHNNHMTEHYQSRRSELHPGSSTARL